MYDFDDFEFKELEFDMPHVEYHSDEFDMPHVEYHSDEFDMPHVEYHSDEFWYDVGPTTVTLPSRSIAEPDVKNINYDELDIKDLLTIIQKAHSALSKKPYKIYHREYLK